jgi:predicted nucleic acid-binding protein
MAIVVDASALAYATITGGKDALDLRHRLRDETVHAPHLIDAELGNVLRRHVFRHDMPTEHADAVLRHAPQIVDHRYAHTGAIASAAWALRHNLTFYDALYAAVAAALGVVLVTADNRLATAPGLPCAVEQVGVDEGR